MKVWRLMVFGVPENLSGLMERLRFKPTKKNPRNWWRIFDATDQIEKQRETAKHTVELLKDAGLQPRWDQVEHIQQPHRDGNSDSGFGHSLNARPIAGSWRRNTRHK